MRDYEKAKTNLENLINAKGITVETVAIEQRPDGDGWGKSYRQTHYSFTVSANGREYTGCYSKGCADVIEALKKGYTDKNGHRKSLSTSHLSRTWDKATILRILNSQTRLRDHAIPEFQQIMRGFAEKLHPNPVDIVWSLLMDAIGSDQDFSDWASELGYDADSIKAKAIWETCNDVRRFVAWAFGSDIETAYQYACEM